MVQSERIFHGPPGGARMVCHTHWWWRHRSQARGSLLLQHTNKGLGLRMKIRLRHGDNLISAHHGNTEDFTVGHYNIGVWGGGGYWKRHPSTAYNTTSQTRSTSQDVLCLYRITHAVPYNTWSTTHKQVITFISNTELEETGLRQEKIFPSRIRGALFKREMAPRLVAPSSAY